MSNQDDLWLWFIDDEPLQALLQAEGDLGAMRVRAASSPNLVRAMSAQMEGRTIEATAILRDAIEAGETQPEAFLFLGQIYFESHDFAEAAATYHHLLRLDPSHAVAAFNEAVCHERLAHWNEAAELFRRAAKADGGRPDAWLGLGLASLHRRRPDDALAAFDRYLTFEPESEPALFGRAVALQMLRRFDDAEAIYNRFRDAGDPSPELLTNLLALAVARKDPDSLRHIAAEMSDAQPGSRQAAEAEAYAAMVSQDWPAAVGHLADCATFDALPEDWAYTNAYALWRLGQPTQAHEQLDAVVRLKPTHADAHLLRGVLLDEAGRSADALAALRKAAAAAPDSEAVAWNMARLAAAEGKPDACLRAAKSLLDSNANSPEGWFAVGLAALLEQQPAQAVEAFTEAVRLRADWPDARWNLGLAQLGAGEFAASDKSLSASAPFLAHPAPVEPRIRAAAGAQNYDRALELLDNAGEAECDPQVIYNLAVGFHEAGRFDMAEPLYRRVIDARVDFADAQINLGHLLLATGRPEEAETLWSDARLLEMAV